MKSKPNENTTLKISVSLILIILFLIIPAQSQFPNSHSQLFCNDCHSGRFSYGATEDDECGNCHDYRDENAKIDLNKLETQHNPKTCKICHSVTDVESFHMLHANVPDSCTRCHTSTGNAVPDKTINECTGCHGGQIHVIHQDNLTNICSKCHGKNPNSAPAGQSLFNSNALTSGIYAKVVDYKQFTLYEIFQRILSLSSIK